MADNTQLFSILDIIMSEYGWTLDYVLDLKSDTVLNLYQAISERKKIEYEMLAKIIAISYSCVKSGKAEKLDNLFSKEEVDGDAQVNQLFELWSGLNTGKSRKEFEEQLKEGKVSI